MIFLSRLTQRERPGRTPSGNPSVTPFVALSVSLALGIGPLPERPAFGLDPNTLPTQYLHADWQDELPQNSVQAILQTRDGYLWLGTQDGLARFDGVRFVEVLASAEQAPAIADVRALAQGDDGRLWIGTRGGGLMVYQDGRIRPARSEADDPAAGPRPLVIYALAHGRDGSLWMGTRSFGVVRFDGDRFQSWSTEQGLASERVLAVVEDSRGDLWAGLAEGGLVRIDDSGASSVGTGILGGETIVSLFEDHRRTLWIGTRGSGLFRLDEDRRSPPRPVSGAETLTVLAMTEDEDGNLWLATYGDGLLRWHEEGSDAVDTAAGLSSDDVLSVFEDREGNLWVGTEGGGLNRLRDGVFKTYGRPEGLLSDQTWTVLEDREGVVWVGTEGGGLARLDHGRVTNLTRDHGLSTDSVTALLRNRSGALWVGSRGQGIQVLEDPTLRPAAPQRFDTVPGFASDTVLAMLQDRSGTVWLGTPRRGLARFSGGRFDPVPEFPELHGELVLALAERADGSLAVGTGSGLRLLGGQGSRQSPNIALELAGEAIFALYADPRDSLWIGTYGGGLHRLQNGRLHTFRRRDGLLSDVVLSILEDDRENLWLGSNQGVFRLAKGDLDAFARGELQRIPAVTYGKTHGLRSPECNGGYQPAGWKDRAGRLWFPTIRGVAVVDPENLVVNEVPPGVVIEEFQVDGSEGERLPFPAGSERFEFRYTGISLSAPEEVRFRYRLEGYDRDWIDAGRQRRATYTHLPAGRRYRFRVTAANQDGIWNETGAGISFSVEPFLYQRPWFRTLAVLILAGGAWLVYRLRVRHLVRRTKHLEGLVADRTREVVAQRDQLGEANEELTHLNEFKTEFLGIAAHDLKTPLSVIYGYARQIADGAGPDNKLERIARRVSSSTNRMLNIVSDLLDTTALETGALRFDGELTDLSELVGEVAERLQQTAAERKIRLLFSPAAGFEAMIDREKMTRVCENLLSNAIRYSTATSTVRVAISKGEDPAAPRARISVQDEGPGLSPSQIEHIFNRFERLAAKHKVAGSSTGLGLFIVKQFVEMHGGSVQVESSPGEGSTFTVEIPMAGPPNL